MRTITALITHNYSVACHLSNGQKAWGNLTFKGITQPHSLHRLVSPVKLVQSLQMASLASAIEDSTLGVLNKSIKRACPPGFLRSILTLVRLQ